MKTTTSSAKESAILTIAAIRPAKGDNPTEYLFHERHSIFTLRSAGAAFEKSAKLLKSALAAKRPVKAVFDTRRGVVERVSAPSEEEVAEFRRGRILLDKPQRTLQIDVSRIDPTRFNLVDYYLKFPVFRLCTRIIPNYAKAKAIFDYCAQQSCSLPGPYGISPCIPFQYVIDGCYARAHKMRWIITTKYNYCCEKVFSFANKAPDKLAVKADKWGGCCVKWWYHVAPLVRVALKFGRFRLQLAMVIDPGMFDKPVLLSTWLAAQENTTCYPYAHVTRYSIQPGSAYTPDYPAGMVFDTDPTYTKTDTTLTNYRNLTTCP